MDSVSLNFFVVTQEYPPVSAGGYSYINENRMQKITITANKINLCLQR